MTGLITSTGNALYIAVLAFATIGWISVNILSPLGEPLRDSWALVQRRNLLGVVAGLVSMAFLIAGVPIAAVSVASLGVYMPTHPLAEANQQTIQGMLVSQTYDVLIGGIIVGSVLYGIGRLIQSVCGA
jgi:hypothetical protein